MLIDGLENNGNEFTPKDSSVNEEINSGTTITGSKKLRDVLSQTDLGMDVIGFELEDNNDEKVAAFNQLVNKYIKNYGDVIDIAVIGKGDFGFDYTTIIFIYDTGENNELLYFSSILAETGPQFISSSLLLDIVTGKNKDASLVFPGVAVNENLTFAVEAFIKRTYGDNYTPRPVEGLVTTVMSEEMAKKLVEVAIKTFLMVNNEVEESEIVARLTENRDIITQMDVEQLDGNIEIVPNDIRKADMLLINKVIQQQKRGIKLANSATLNKRISTVSVFVDVTITTDEHSNLQLAPEVTVDYTHLSTTSYGMIFPALYSATIMSANRSWVSVLANQVKNGKQPGYVNALIPDSETGENRKAFVFSKKNSKQEIVNTLASNIVDAPVYSIIVKPFFMGGTEGSLLIDAAKGDGTAENYVKSKIRKLVPFKGDGEDPLFKIPMFSGYAKLYTGLAQDESGNTYPIESLELSKVVELYLNNKNISFDTVIDFYDVMGGNGNSTLFVDILQRLGIEAQINGEAYKLIFNSEFISYLMLLFRDTPFDSISINNIFTTHISRESLTASGINNAYRNAGVKTHRQLKGYGYDSNSYNEFDYRVVDGYWDRY